MNRRFFSVAALVVIGALLVRGFSHPLPSTATADTAGSEASVKKDSAATSASSAHSVAKTSSPKSAEKKPVAEEVASNAPAKKSVDADVKVEKKPAKLVVAKAKTHRNSKRSSHSAKKPQVVAAASEKISASGYNHHLSNKNKYLFNEVTAGE
jgi:DsbC/DsbD-like thiol-disulfide interchange protein